MRVLPFSISLNLILKLTKSFSLLDLLIILVFTVFTATWSCDPQSNNKPSCSSRILNVPVRNFWDPTVYWMCSEANAEAELLKCPDGNLFDSLTHECIAPNKWVWTKPCSAKICDPESNNQPICDDINLNEPVRNFWDPTAYWMCTSANGEAELFKCPDSYLFDSTSGQCVTANKWVWTSPCPKNY